MALICNLEKRIGPNKCVIYHSFGSFFPKFNNLSDIKITLPLSLSLAISHNPTGLNYSWITCTFSALPQWKLKPLHETQDPQKSQTFRKYCTCSSKGAKWERLANDFCKKMETKLLQPGTVFFFFWWWLLCFLFGQRRSGKVMI